MILLWLVLTFQIRAVKCVRRNELDICHIIGIYVGSIYKPLKNKF